jgi:hypothetical protein
MRIKKSDRRDVFDRGALSVLLKELREEGH